MGSILEVVLGRFLPFLLGGIRGTLLWVADWLVANSKSLLGNILVSLGFSIVTGVVLKTAASYAISAASSTMPFASYMDAFGITDFLAILTSAVVTRAALRSARMHIASTPTTSLPTGTWGGGASPSAPPSQPWKL